MNNHPSNTFRPLLSLGLLVAIGLLSFPVDAGPRRVPGPWAMPGEMGLRNDIRLLADAGAIRGIVMAWPLDWGDIGSALQGASSSDLGFAELAAFNRVQERVRQMTVTNMVTLNGYAAYAEKPKRIRTFEDSPREDGEVGIGAAWTGDWLAVNLQGQWIDNPSDGKEWRADGSYVGIALGNWAIAGQVTDRWWGPGWQSNMILSNNARPIPSITIDRNRTDPFKSRWLSWIGPWDFNVSWGFLESDRELSEARFFSMRLDLRPFQWFEFGVSRVAVWCGGGRSCGWSSFWDMFTGKDNVGQGVTPENEPGDQIAGFDARITGMGFGWPVALYGQRIGEDTKDFLPSLFLVQVGAEYWGNWERLGGYRIFVEASDTLCGGNLIGSGKANCGLNNGLQKTGERYRGRPFTNTFDNDAKIFTLGAILNDVRDNTWTLNTAFGELNREGGFDPENTVSPVPADYLAIDVTHQRPLWNGLLDVGVGYERRKMDVLNATEDDFRFYVQWGISL